MFAKFHSTDAGIYITGFINSFVKQININLNYLLLNKHSFIPQIHIFYWRKNSGLV